MMEIISEKHSQHKIGCHIVWCTKYRHQIIDGLIEFELKKILSEICVEYGWKLHAMEIMPDHVHLFIQYKPTECITNIVKTLKSISAVYIFQKFPNLKGQHFWGSGLWSRGTYYGSVGEVSQEIVKKYIENQKSKN